MKIKVDIIIPVLNEEDTLEINIVKILNFVESEISDIYICRVVIADNGSIDRTPEVGKELENVFKNRVLYKRVERKGVGLALKSTWLSSDADIVGYMDLDLATDLRHLPEVLNILLNKKIDIVYGTRLHKASEVIGRTIKREIVSRIFNSIVKMYLHTGFSDGMCGFKFLKRDCVDLLIKNGAESDGWFFSTELLIVAEWMKLEIYELPVKWTDDPSSKVNILKLSLEYIRAMRHLKSKRI